VFYFSFFSFLLCVVILRGEKKKEKRKKKKEKRVMFGCGPLSLVACGAFVLFRDKNPAGRSGPTHNT
jgi:hypothetical protein